MEGHWDYGELIREQYHIVPDDYLDASVWGFPKERDKVNWVRKLNQVLYLMMTDEYEANGEATEAKLLALVEALFSQRYVETNVSAGWESATAVEKYIANAVEHPDPLWGWDWGESAERQLEKEMEHHRGGVRGMSDAGRAWARLQMRRQMLTKIAQLGGLLKEQPLKERGGQPEIEYEHPRLYKDVADEKANQITQLPPHQALVRIQGAEGMVENHLRTIHAEMEWPKGSDNPTERIRENTRKRYGVPLGLVREGLRRRARPYDIVPAVPDTAVETSENGSGEVEEEFPAFGLIDA